MGLGISVTLLDSSGAGAGEFDDWYETEHKPRHLAIPGFRKVQRWTGTTEPDLALFLHDLDSPDVLRTHAYRPISAPDASPWSRRIARTCRQVMYAEAEQVLPGTLVAPDGAAALLLIGFNIPPEIEADFNSWYDTEHLPALAAVPGVISARRFRGAETSPRYFAIYHLTAPGIPDSPAWKHAVDTPWSARMRPHFRDRVRGIFLPHRRDH